MNQTHRDPNLENALRNALRREAAPDGLAAKILTRVGQQSMPAEKDHWFSFLFQPILRWAAIAAVSVCLVAGGMYYRNLRRERAQGEAAKQQLMLALRIAGSKLQLAKEKVNEMNQPPNQVKARPARSRS